MRWSQRLPGMIRDSFVPIDGGRRAIDFAITGTTDKPKTNLLDKLIGQKINTQFGDVLGSIFGGDKKPDDDKPKKDDKKGERRKKKDKEEGQGRSRTPRQPGGTLRAGPPTAAPAGDPAAATRRRRIREGHRRQRGRAGLATAQD